MATIKKIGIAEKKTKADKKMYVFIQFGEENAAMDVWVTLNLKKKSTTDASGTTVAGTPTDKKYNTTYQAWDKTSHYFEIEHGQILTIRDGTELGAAAVGDELIGDLMISLTQGGMGPTVPAILIP